MKTNLKLNSSGDTIIEVLVVLAVLSLAFVTSYSIATKSLGQSRNAQEHSETLGRLNAQAEWLRSAVAAKIALPVNTPFCMTSPTTFDQSFLPGNGVAGSAAGANFSKYPNACKHGFYGSSIVYTGEPGGNFDIKLRWDGNGSTGRQQEQLNYRTHELVADATGGVPTTTTSPQITVKVAKINPDTGLTTPLCSKAAGTTPRGGTSVTLKQANGGGKPSTQSTDNGSSLVVFTAVQEGETYTVTINGVPPSYELCDGSNLVSTPQTTPPATLGYGEQRMINRYKIRPICGVNSGVGPPYAHYLGNYSDYQGYYRDYYGYYGDPYTVYWDEQKSVDLAGHTPGRYKTLPTAVDSTYYWNWRGDLGYSTTKGWFYELWQHRSGTAYTAPYDHYSGYYDHWSAPYDHYSEPYGDPYSNPTCPS